MSRRNEPFWTKVFFQDFSAHFIEMTDQEIVKDIKKSLAALAKIDERNGSFGAKMVTWAKERMDTPAAEASRKNGSNGGRPPKNNDQVTVIGISANGYTKDASRGNSDDDCKAPPSFNPADASTREGEDELTHTGNRGSLESGTSAGNILPQAGAVAPVGNAGDELAMPARVASESATSVPAARPLRDTIDPVIRDTFEAFRKAYKGQKNGLEVELQNFVRACRKLGYDYTLEVVKLMPAWEAEHRARLEKELSGGFFPHPKNLKTWLNNACWLQTLNTSPDVSQLTQGERIILRNHLMEAQDEQEEA